MSWASWSSATALRWAISASVTLNFVNKGRDALSNLEATLSGDNLGADTTVQYIGNLNAGSSNSVDFDMTPTQEGTCNGTITLTYEDANGTLKTVQQSFFLLCSAGHGLRQFWRYGF